MDVTKPARYVGGEYNQIVKDKLSVKIRFALCFPDTYEIGMSNLGMRILYGALNTLDDVWCERVFEPWRDMSDAMKQLGMPLFALESGDPVSDFDIIGFSVGYEMSYVGILNMLKLAGIPLLSKERRALKPLVFAGGTCMYNPEPIADFIDLAVIGEGEELDIELVELYKKAKAEDWDKNSFLLEASKISGVYVPSLYTHTFKHDGTLESIVPENGAPETVCKRVIQNLDKSYYPVRDIVPSTEVVHDRTVLEVFRGCYRGCRFCQAGFVCRPVRSKSHEVLLAQAKEALLNSGYQELNLSSLSTSDYGDLDELCSDLLDFCTPRGIGLSLPSLRADNFSVELLKKIQKVRKSGLTFAPEAGTQRLRDVINKNITEDDIINSCKTAFEGGYNAVKLYFMLGLPTETDDDVLGIADLAYKVLDTWKKYSKNKNRGVKITVSASCFVPKPHTPFQWEKQTAIEELERRQQLLKTRLKSRHITFNWHSPETSFIEAVIARGDRRLGQALLSVMDESGGLNAWSEFFSFEVWQSAFRKHGIESEFYANRQRDYGEVLPWSVISAGVSKTFLIAENERAKSGETTADCKTKCSGCGADTVQGDRLCGSSEKGGEAADGQG